MEPVQIPRERIRTPKTFQRKLVLYNFLIVICIAGAISFYNYTSYRSSSYQAAIVGASDRVSSLSSNLEVGYNEMVNIVLTCTERSSLFRYLSMASRSPNASDDGSPYQVMTVYSSNILRDFCAISGYSKHIYKLTMKLGDLVLQAGNSYGHSSDATKIMEQPWFDTLLKKQNSQYTLSLVDNPFSKANNVHMPKILPLVRPINATNVPGDDAWVFLGISSSLFEEFLSTLPNDRILFIVTGAGDIIASQNGSRYETTGLIETLIQSSQREGQLSLSLSGDDCTVIYHTQDVSRLLIFEILPEKDVLVDHSIIMRTIIIIFLFCIVIGLGLSYVISHQLGSPISRLVKRIQLISQGDFEADTYIETHDEIGMIGKQINEMSNHISTLMDSRIQNEKEKKDMEIKMLQAQINPHFLYNTLDSIKWIATIQKNTGIVQVVTALSSLLKNMAKGFNEKVTLRQELDFLQNYIVIEKIRYIELFDVETTVDSESLYDARIIKLTLQPIVENAIFSGIEPSGRTGLIQINAYAENQTLYVTVTDNGIGISPESIEKILTDTARVTRSNMSGIGLPNVDRRMKLVYGEQYGLTIESRPDEYTKVTISLPLEL